MSEDTHNEEPSGDGEQPNASETATVQQGIGEPSPRSLPSQEPELQQPNANSTEDTHNDKPSGDGSDLKASMVAIMQQGIGAFSPKSMPSQEPELQQHVQYPNASVANDPPSGQAQAAQQASHSAAGQIDDDNGAKDSNDLPPGQAQASQQATQQASASAADLFDVGDGLFVPVETEFVMDSLSGLGVEDWAGFDPSQENDDTEEDLNMEDDSPTPKSKGKKGKKPAKSGPRKRKRVQPMMNNISLDNLTSNNIIQDAAAAANMPSMPDMTAGTKAEALRALKLALTNQGLKPPTNELNQLYSAISQFEGRRVQCVTGGFRVFGIKTVLYAHQIIGIGFMRSRETHSTGPNDPHGGILADTMGLGKTLMMLTNIVNGRPKNKRDRKPTLVVAKPALLRQWFEEAHKHVQMDADEAQGSSAKYGLSSIAFYKYLAATHKNKRKLLDAMMKHDIVLATYNMVSRSYPLPKEVPSECITAQQKQDWITECFKEAGPLHQMQWHRVVLDEAHAIKNFSSITSKACRTLKAGCYWAMTGTPIHNDVSEFYPYLKLVRDPWIISRAQFVKAFCAPEEQANAASTLKELLSRVMVRRTHATSLFGARLITLPHMRPSIDMELEFSAIEQTIYDTIREGCIDSINSCIRSTETNKYRNILAILLRLRQMTGHFLLLRDAFSDILTLPDIQELHDFCARSDKDAADKDAMVMQIELKSMLENAENIKTNERGVRKLVQSQAPLVVSLSGMTPDQLDALGEHGQQSMRPEHVMDALTDGMKAITERAVCVLCHHKPHKPHYTDCSHIYCLECVERVEHRAALLGRRKATCKACEHEFQKVLPCIEVPDPIEPAAPADDSAARKKRKLDGKKSKNAIMEGPVPPSTKTKAMQARVRNWLEEPDCKVIVYTQFRTMLTLLGRICKTEDWTYEMYHGGMSEGQRTAAITKFSDPASGVRILLASLKAGGEGLNLTAASRVLLMDPWWNDSVEQQAFCRIYRIGQERETELCRLVVRGTIDEYMYDVKIRKQDSIDPVVDGKRDSQMGLEDIMRAIGPVEHDSEGRPYIVSGRKNNDTDEGLNEVYEIMEE